MKITLPPSTQRLVLPGLVIGYLIATSLFAALTPLTHDEFFTYYIATLPRIADLWQALRETIDFHPPLHFLLTRGCVLLFGPTPWAVRLPAVLSGLLFLVALYRLLEKRVGLPVILIALLLPAATHCYHFFFTSRPYMLMLAMAAWGVYFWMQAEQARRFSRHSLWMGVFFFLAGMSHYYAVLAYFPPAVVEGYRLARKRRFHSAHLICLFIAGIATIAVLYPFALHARLFSQTFWRHSSVSQILPVYNFFLGERTFILWTVVATVILFARAWRSHQKAKPIFTVYERVLVGALIAMPLVGAAVSGVTHAGFTNRYVLITLIGLALGLAGLAQRYLRIPKTGGLIAGIMLLWCFALWGKDFRWMHGQYRAVVDDATSLVQFGGRKDPIVIGHYDIFMQYAFYAPAAERERLVFIKSEEFSRLYTEAHDCTFAPEALLDVAGISTDPQVFSRLHPSFLCLLSPLDREAPKLLGVTRKTPLDWKVGEYQLYRCDTAQAQRTVASSL